MRGQMTAREQQAQPSAPVKRDNNCMSCAGRGALQSTLVRLTMQTEVYGTRVSEAYI